MLTLEGPSLLVDGVAVFRDDRDATAFYYVNDRPRIARLVAEDGETRGALKLIHFASAEEVETEGGFLFGDVDLGVSEDWRARAESELRARLGVTGRVTLRPPDWEDGTVRFLVLGESNPVEGDGEAEEADRHPVVTDPEGNDFRVLVDAAAAPSLMGDNRAVFQARLGATATRIVRAALEDRGAILPIGVVYSLSFLAKRPAFRVSVEADWDVVFHRLEEQFTVGISVLRVEVDDVVQELIDQKAFQVKVDITDPEAEETATQMAEELKALVLEHFFEPMAKPTEAGDDTGDDVLDFLSGLRHLHTGVVGFSRRELTAEMRMSFDAAAEVVRAVERRVWPQGHLVGMVEGSALDPAGLVQVVDLEDFMRRVRVPIRALVPWEDHHVDEVTVDVRYGSTARSFRFTAPGAVGGERDAAGAEFVALRQEALGSTVTYRWTVRFADDRAGHSQLSSDELTTDSGLITLDDNELYSWRDARVRVDPQTWDDFRSVQLDLQVVGSEEPAHRRRLVLNAPQPGGDPEAPTEGERVWSVVFPGTAAPPLAAVATFRTPSGEQHTTTLEPRPDWRIEVRSPLISTLSLTCFVDEPQEGDVVLLEISLTDPGSGAADIRRVVFESSVPDPGETVPAHGSSEHVALNDFFVLEQSAPADWAGTFWFRQIIFGATGERIRTAWRPSREREVVLGRGPAHRWPVTVRADGEPFLRTDVELITVDLWVPDEGGSRSQEQRIVLREAGERSLTVIEIDEPARPRYRYEVEHRSRFGRRARSGEREESATELSVSTAFPD